MGNSIVKGTIWSFIQRFGGLAISFISNIVLARLLCPEDFGIVGMVMIFVSLADSFVDGGLGNALIQKKNISDIDIKTVFTANFVISLFFFLLVCFSAPFIESYTNINDLSLYIRVGAILILIKAFYVIPASLINKSLQFETLAKINLFSSAISVVVSILMAYNGFGVWSLLCRNIILDVSLTLLLMVISKYRSQFGFCKTIFKELFSFGFFVLLSNLVESLYAHAVTFFIGKQYSVKELGYYNQAYSLQQMPVYSITSVLNAVLFPYFSKIQDQQDQVKSKLQMAIEFATFVVFPLLLFLIIFAKEIIIIVYSDKWLLCAPYFQLFCVAGLFNALIHINRSVLKSEGASKIVFIIQVTNTIIGVILFLVGLQISMFYTVLAYVLNSVILYVMTASFVGKIIGYNLALQIKHIAPNLTIAILSAAICLCCSCLCFSIYINVAIGAILNFGLYICIHHLCKTRVSLNIMSLIKSCKY